MMKNNSTGYKGVVSRYGGKTFRAKITVNKKVIWLGSFRNAIDAAKIYDKAARFYFGEFAKANFPVLL